MKMLTWRRDGTGTFTKCNGTAPWNREALTRTWQRERIDEKTEDLGETIVLRELKRREETTKRSLVVKRDSSGWNCTARLGGTVLRCFVGSAGALIYSGGV